ncbi:hypothetical protein [uncultured Fluviicola sp.]|uniref:hypothetical protein n=1 Tax=uncultured Fluviicola sp. TaxID=463303 RepID=UPI0025E1281C|nr:hypothetical protein [uncultured Fluviicola sp.]
MYGEVLAVVIIVASIVLAGVIVVAVFFFKNLQDLLKECDPANQQLPPANVWLMFIPLFNIVYRFIMYPKVSETLKREFESRGAPQQGDYLKGLGLALSIANAVNILLPQSIRGLIGLGCIAVMIVYWTKAAEMKNKLRSLPKGDGGVRFSDNPDLLD